MSSSLIRLARQGLTYDPPPIVERLPPAEQAEKQTHVVSLFDLPKRYLALIVESSADLVMHYVKLTIHINAYGEASTVAAGEWGLGITIADANAGALDNLRVAVREAGAGDSVPWALLWFSGCRRMHWEKFDREASTQREAT